MSKSKELTPRQTAFIDAFFGPAHMDVEVAKEMAGYSKNTSTAHVVTPIMHLIEEALKAEVAVGAAQGLGALMDVLRDPTKPGNKERIAAANSLLDRFGMTKEKASQTNIKVEVAPVVYLPEKRDLELSKDDYIDITD